MKEYISSEPESVVSLLKSDSDKGLTTKEVEQRKEEHGLNQLPEGKVTPWFVIFLKTLIEPIQLILIFAAIISIVAPFLAEGQFEMESMIDFGVIMVIVLIDAILATVQTVKARKSMDALKSLSKPKTVVIRDDQQFEIDASQLVPGDIVILEAGRYVPADLRIIESSELMIDESVLTGESVPVRKGFNFVEETNILAEMTNIAFMSTFTTNGRALGIVIKTGKNTEIGKIAQSVNSNDHKSTPLEHKLERFSYWIAGLAAVLGALIFTSLYFGGSNDNWSNYLMIAITLAIGVIPECLSAVVSITLSMSTKRMAKENVIVKKLASVETLGSVNVICTDKTGTLTQNRMTITKMIMDNKIVDGNSYAKEKSDNHMDLFLKSLVLCNDSVTEGNERIGDPTELALIDYAEKLGWDEQDARDKWDRIFEKPFDSERKMMTTVNEINGVNTTFTKGALDELLKRCKKIMIDNKIMDLSPKHVQELHDISKKLSSDALRVLGFAYHLEYDKLKDKEDIENELVFLGGVAMIDPVRSSAIEAIKQAHDAGIKVVMITGDHAVTALAIAKELDLAHSDHEVISSEQLEKMNDEQLEKIVEDIKVFARVNPEHKVKIVELLQKAQNITSMTGDGVNDAPSLAKADIGVAMGITGTDVAKQAADVILTDDNFATIIKGVYEGRNVYQKIKRAIAFVIGVNLANVLAIFILSLINGVSPLEATNILWMNLVVESVLAITMGMGNNDPSLMKQNQYMVKNSIFRGLGLTIGLIILFTTLSNIGAYYVGMQFIDESLLKGTINGYNYDHSNFYAFFQDDKISLAAKQHLSAPGRTAMFLAITVAPSIYVNTIKLSNWKADKKINIVLNKPLLIASIATIFVNVLVVFLPGLNDKILELQPIADYTATNWLFIPIVIPISMGPTILLLIVHSIRFISFHYRPESWERNRTIVSEMVKEDKELDLKKQKKQKNN